MNQLKAIVIGTSAGGPRALKSLLEKIPPNFVVPILVVQHLSADSDDSWIYRVSKNLNRIVREAEDKENIKNGHVYIAPPDYHMMVGFDETIVLSKDDKVNFSRPSIDVLFESASDVYGKSLAGIILTGTNSDGAIGMVKINKNGGILIAQNPHEAEYRTMPEEAIRIAGISNILDIDKIPEFLMKYNSKKTIL